MERISKIKKWSIIIMEIIVQGVCLIPWIVIGEGKYSAATYLIRIFSSGDAFLAMQQDFSSVMDLSYYAPEELNTILLGFVFRLVGIAFVQLVSATYLLLTIFNRKTGILDIMAMVAGAATAYVQGMSEAIWFGTKLEMVYEIILIVPIGILFIGVRAMEAWQNANKEYAERKAREAAWKEERKRRLAFPGKYTRLFYRIIWKNFQAEWKDYVILVSAGVMAAGIIFSGIGMAEMLSPLGGGGSILRRNGIAGIVMNFLIVILAISVFLMVSVLLSYLRKRMKNYGIFVNLGIRKKTLYLYMGVEFAGCMLLSVIGGYLLGNVVLLVIRLVMQHGTDMGERLGNISGETYVFTFLLTSAVLLISMVIVHDMYLSTGVTQTKDRAVEKERMPGKCRAVFLVMGIILSVWGIMRFSQRRNAEGIGALLILFAGLFFVIKNGWAMVLMNRKKNRKKYYSTLIRNNSCYHRFKTTFRYVFFLGSVHVAVLFMFSKELVSNMIAQEPETLFPYSHMCMATEKDEDFFEKLKTEYEIQIQSYPMVRVSNVDNTEMPEDFRVPVIPQGQHIGVSESTYYELCRAVGKEPENLNLSEDGREVYIVYQQDKSVKAHPIDYFLTRKEPYLHIGQPVEMYGYLEREKIFPKRIVAGEKIGNLTGTYRSGNHENVIVFSNEYFASVQDEWKTTNWVFGNDIRETGEEGIEDVNIHQWPTRLVLMNVPDAKLKAVEKELQTFKKSHAFDEKFDSDVLSYYSSAKQIAQIKSERIMNIEVNTLIIVVLTSIGLFMLYLKFASELDEKKNRQEFLLCIGMKRKERIQVLKTEVRTFFKIPVFMTAFLIPLLTGIMWKLREYTPEDCLAYSRILAVIMICYFGVQVISMKLMEIYLIRKVEGKYERNHQNQ